MKKITLLAITMTALILTSCQSAGKTSAKSNSDKNKPFITIGNLSNFEISDEADFYTLTALGNIKLKQGKVTVNKKKNTIGFGSSYMAAYYIVFISPDNIAKLEKAYETYLEDFEQKNLNRTAKNTYKKYGKIQADLNWGTIQSMTPNFGSGDAYIGYKFHEKSPYFTLTIHPVFNKYSEVTSSADYESLTLEYYFTKKQMENLIFQMKALLSKEAEVQPEIIEEPDEY